MEPELITIKIVCVDPPQDYSCSADLETEEVIKAIRDEFLLQGGALTKRNGERVLPSRYKNLASLCSEELLFQIDQFCGPTNNQADDLLCSDFSATSNDIDGYFKDHEKTCRKIYCLTRERFLDNANISCCPIGYKFCRNDFKDKLHEALDKLIIVDDVDSAWEVGVDACRTKDDVLDWYCSSIRQWGRLKSMLSNKYDGALKGTFNVHIMSSMSFILANLNFLCEWKEKKSMSSAHIRDETEEIDCMVNEFGEKVFLFQNSMSTNGRESHGKQDRVKLAHAMFCATYQELIDTSGGYVRDLKNYGCVGLQLCEKASKPHLVAYQSLLNEDSRAWELHQLFSLQVPLQITKTVECRNACSMLQHMYALALLIASSKELLMTLHNVKMLDRPPESDDDSYGGSEMHRGGRRDSGENEKKGGKYIPPVQIKPTLSKKHSLSYSICGKYSLGVLLVADDGAFSTVLSAVRLCDKEKVVFKIHASKSRHLVELHALQRLRHVNGVVNLVDFFDFSDGYTLILPYLESIRYSDIAQSDMKMFSFMISALRIVRDMHAVGVAHCDIKPSAFMINAAQGGNLTVIDFNLSLTSSCDLVMIEGLPGTPGWVHDDAGCRSASELDYIGLASVFGWVIGVPGFGDSGTCYRGAVYGLNAFVKSKFHSSSARMMLQVVSALFFRDTTIGQLIDRMESFQE